VLQGSVPNPQSADEVINTLAFNRAVRERVSDACRTVFGYSVETQLIPGPKQSLVAVDKQGHAINAVNLGSGFVQYLWILLYLELSVLDSLALSYKPVPFVGVEEPELHLHPASQRYVADALVRFVKADRQLICTTQNEHFLMALLQLVLEGTLAPTELAVYYIEAGTVQRLTVDEQGRLSGGLKGFFEVGEKELFSRLSRLLPDG
jgi:predicted ATPase